MKPLQTSGILSLILLFPRLAEAAEPAPPFARTEAREPCAHYTATRQPLFGELHLHTVYSFDAAGIGTRNTPWDAYRFARGEEVGLAPFFDTRRIAEDESEPPVDGVSRYPYCLPGGECQFTAMRTIQLPKGRALDFAAVTDHSEWLGETNICLFEGPACSAEGECAEGLSCQGQNPGTCVPQGYDSPSCLLVRDELTRLTLGAAAGVFAAVALNPQPQRRLPFCGVDGEVCLSQAQNVWQQIQAAAEHAYDRTNRCAFTSLIGYEYTAMPALNQCKKSLRPCIENADCGPGDQCAAAGQCAGEGSPDYGAFCFDDDGCASGRCVPDQGGNNLHRNVIFRNGHVPKLPVSYADVPTGCGSGDDCEDYQGPYDEFPPGTFASPKGGALGSPVVMLQALEEQCNGDDPARRCDFLSIPHNSNLSGGAMFLMPESPEEARIRGDRERLVEIFQIKGGSECRFSARHPLAWQPGASSPDELCDFENMSFAKLGGAYQVDPNAQAIPASSYVRNVLEDGLRYRQEHPEEVNPFKLGFVGGLDNHNGTPGASEEEQYAKAGAHADQSYAANGQMLNETFFLGLETNGGGLTAVWAEENSRDSLFTAMQRRETYATSGTRPTVRFFGGFDLPPAMCERGGDFARQGYAAGVPMGETLTVPSGKGEKAPRFAVFALMDPGWEGHRGATLQRAQIVKGWVDRDGEVHEQVYDVAGGRDRAVPVDLSTCQPGEPGGGGLAHLCSVWTDPQFDPGLHAFYYARVLENPSCRWNQYYCLDRGVDCSRPPATGASIVGYGEYEYQQCCSDLVPKAVQQRAWTSPIWYEP